MMWTTMEERNRRLAQAEVLFKTDCVMPDVVNRLGLSNRPFFDGDVLLGFLGGWEMASSLAELHGDSEVHFITLDNDPGWFYSEGGHYGGFTLATVADSDTYQKALYSPQGGESRGWIGYITGVAALFGDSLKWGIWVERDVTGIVVVEDRDHIADWEVENGPFLAVEDALKAGLGYVCRPELHRIIARNYAS